MNAAEIAQDVLKEEGQDYINLLASAVAKSDRFNKKTCMMTGKKIAQGGTYYAVDGKTVISEAFYQAVKAIAK